MTLDEILESTVSVVKTVWQKRGKKVARKDVSRVVATSNSPKSRKKIEVKSDE